jgi:hypothetical protein
MPPLWQYFWRLLLTGSLTEESITPEAQENLLRIFGDWKGS